MLKLEYVCYIYIYAVHLNLITSMKIVLFMQCMYMHVSVRICIYLQVYVCICTYMFVSYQCSHSLTTMIESGKGSTTWLAGASPALCWMQPKVGTGSQARHDWGGDSRQELANQSVTQAVHSGRATGPWGRARGRAYTALSDRQRY